MRYIVLSIILLSSGCSTLNTQPASSHLVNVALLVPLSGEAQHIGRSIEQAAKLAIEDHHQKKVNLEVIDTGSDVDISQSAIKKVKSGNFKAIIGPLFASHARSLAANNRKQIPIVTFSNDSTLAGTQNLYLAGFMPQQQIEKVIHYAHANQYKVIYALVPQSKYGELVTKLLTDMKQKYGYDIREVFYYAPGKAKEAAQKIVDIAMPKVIDLSDLSTISVEKIAILIPEGNSNLREITQYIAENRGDDNGDVRFLGTSQWRKFDLVNLPGTQGAWIALPPQLSIAQFENKFAKKSEVRAPEISALGYDMTQLISVLSDRSSINEDIKTASGFSGFTGTFRFLENGENQRKLSIVEVRDHKFKEVEPAADNFPA